MSDHEPTMLLATKLYSTFQLCCCVFPDNESYSVHDVFNKVILYVMDWFRFRAGDDEESVEKIAPYPLPDEYHGFDLESLPDIKIRESFSMNTLFLPDRANWAFRLSEPDNYAEFDKQGPESIILGRSFITNIAVQENDRYVTLSYKCACKEPKKNTKDCKVFRPRFFKTLCRDTNLLIRELPNTDPEYDRIWEQCISITSNSFSNHLANELIRNEKRQLPVLLFTGDTYDSEIIDEAAESLMGFCHVFYVTDRQFNRLFRARLNNNDVEVGDVILYQQDLDYDVIDMDEEMSDIKSIVSLIRTYPVRRSIDYRETLFYREAKAAKFEPINSNDPTELLERVVQQEEIIEDSARKIREITADVDSLQEQLRSVKHELKSSEDLCDSYKTMYEGALKDNVDSSQRATYFKTRSDTYRTLLRTILNFPIKVQDVAQWVKSNYSEQLILLERAENHLQRYDKQLDLRLLCSGIMYLNAYMLWKRKRISDEVLDLYRIGKPWDIELCGKHNVYNLSGYKIDISQYGTSEKTDYLDFHLKSGNKADNLLRIYFSINNELDKIIIGHLPDHLPIQSRTH